MIVDMPKVPSIALRGHTSEKLESFFNWLDLNAESKPKNEKGLSPSSKTYINTTLHELRANPKDLTLISYR